MLRISVTSKLDGIRSWSLQALDTCPGSILEPATESSPAVLVAACEGCYATQGNYRYPNVKAPRLENRIDWERDDWEDDMVRELQDDEHFRWFDSGDSYALALAKKIYNVMRRTPWCKHWIPTRMGKFPKFQEILAMMEALPNVKVRFSSDSVSGEYVKGKHGSTIVPTSDNVPEGVAVCRAYEHGGKCNGCRVCWDKSVPVVAYVAHGKKMAKVIRLRVA